MNPSDDDQQPDDGGGGAPEAPAVVLPSPNTQGVGGQPSGLPTGVLIAPQPVVADDGDVSNLAGRIEQTLAEDGRFSAFAPNLVITTDDGTVHLSGPLPSEGRRQSLLATIRALPGVVDVQDHLTVS